MKRLIFSLFLMFSILLTINAYAVTNDVASYISSNTVTFNITGTVASFNSVTRHIIIWNNSVTQDCYVDFVCASVSGKPTISPNTVVLIPAAGKVTPNMVTLDFATKNIGVSTNTAGVSGTVTYIATGNTQL